MSTQSLTRVLLALSLVLGATHAHALTWQQALEQSHHAAPRTALEQARLTEARAAVDVATVLPNPTLTLGSYVETSRLYVALQVPLPVFGSVGLAGDAARARIAETQLSNQTLQLTEGLDVLRAWIDTWSLHAQLRTTDDTIAQLTRVAQAADALVSQGQRPAFEAISAHAELDTVTSEREALTHELLAARQTLSARLGQDASQPLADTEGDPPGSADTPASLVSEHPAVQALQARARSAHADAQLEERQRIPIPNLLLGGYFLRATGAPVDVFIGLGFDLPILNQRAPQIARARARESAANAEAHWLEAQLSGNQHAALERLEAARVRVQSQQTVVLPQAEQALTLALASYRAGRLDLAGLLAAQQRLILTRARLDQSTVATSRAYIDLLAAVGELP